MHRLANHRSQPPLVPPDYLQRQRIDHDALTDPVILECLACGRTYHRGVSRFCSPRCRVAFDAGVSAREHAVVRYSLPAAGDTMVCAGCAKQFSSRGLKYCSAECARDHRKKASASAGVKLTRVCPCGNPIPMFRGIGKARRAVRNDVVYCSDKCRQNPAEWNSARNAVLTAISSSYPLISLGSKDQVLGSSVVDLTPGKPGRRVGSLRVWGPGLSEIANPLCQRADGMGAAMSVTLPRGYYSAGIGRMLYLAIVDETNLHLVPDNIVTAIDGARAIGGVCLICPRSFEREAPVAFAVLRRAGGFEPPTARGVCATCSHRFDHAALRLRALEAIHRGPGA